MFTLSFLVRITIFIGYNESLGFISWIIVIFFNFSQNQSIGDTFRQLSMYQKKLFKTWESEKQFTDSEHTWSRTANKSFLFLGKCKSPGCWYPQKMNILMKGYYIGSHHTTLLVSKRSKNIFIALATKLDSYWMFSRVRIHVQLWHTTVGLMSLSSFDLRVTYSMRCL